MNPIMEEEDQEEHKKQQHACKFCRKRFPCGRSLGGHMRSHVISYASSSYETDHHHQKKLSSSFMDNNNNTCSEAAGAGYGYGLRENPKKTWRLTDPSTSEDEGTLLDKFCKECGKRFQSWKALFGHMKCHYENSGSLDDQDYSSWNNNNNDAIGSQSENENENENEASAPNRRRGSKRRRYMAATSAAASASCNSVSEEQEEVAMSLMMLSRDVGNWRDGLNSFLDKKLEFGKLGSSNLNSKGKISELLATESAANGIKMMMDKNTVSIIKVGKEKKHELDSQSPFEVNGEGLVLVPSKSASASNNKYNSIKAKFLNSKTKSNSLSNEYELSSSKSSQPHKRGNKFECTTCNKIFHSYQALGGHRASHKKTKGCFASRNGLGSEENSNIEFEAAETTESNKYMKNSEINNNKIEYLEEHEEVEEGKQSRKGKGHHHHHECPICLKVFQSGQALGGHKRSHLAAAGSETSSRNFQSQKVVLQESSPSSVPEIRDFLDLNLPPSSTEEPWWVLGRGSNHNKQEALVGLMS